ncbi:MAG: hypothetical protein EAZ91_25575 [Cytophagales bacterium]|nr:MAG: hypothetical protein EAZ91_25575 [Cytophagales bacterium]
MQATYQLNESELTYQFLQGLKKTFRGKKVKILIKEEKPHEMTQEEFENMVATAQASDHAYSVSGEQWDQLLTQYEADDSINVAEELQKHRIER